METGTLSSASVISNIKSCHKNELLSFVSTLSKSDIRDFLFSRLKQSHPQIKPLIDNIWNYSDNRQSKCSSKIYKYFVNPNANKSEIIQSSSLLPMPSTIIAYIISFNTMNDRLKHQLICKDFYIFCNNKISKYHLVIDHKLVKAIHNNLVTYSKFINCKYIDVRYVFKNKLSSLQKYGDLESKYYTFIAKILFKSPSLHTLNYNLKYQSFKSDLLSKIRTGYGDYGHLNRWISNVEETMHTYNKKYSDKFDCIKHLIWIPSQFGYMHRSHFGFGTLQHFLPNLISVKIPKIKVYERFSSWGPWDMTQSYDELTHLTNPFYYSKLQHITYNMIPSRKSLNIRRNIHINIDHHPLYHFYKFSNLKLLDLKLPIFDQCAKYYNKLWKQHLSTRTQQTALRALVISFDTTNVTLLNDSAGPTIPNTFTKTINQIIKYILSICINMSHYTFVGNNMSCLRGNNYVNPCFDHLIGFYDRLEFVDTDCIEILPANQRLSGLKSLTVRFYYGHTSINKIMGKLNLLLYPNLESFKLIHVNNTRFKYTKLNHTNYLFVDYLLKQKVKLLTNTKLKYAAFEHQTLNKKKEVKLQRKQFFNAQTCSKNLSEKICKLITELMVLDDGLNCNLESLELKPVGMLQAHIDYLSFWFDGKFGAFNAEKYNVMKSDLFLTDLLCISHNSNVS